MKLIKPSYKIETPINGEEILIAIEAAGRTAYKSEDKIEIKRHPILANEMPYQEIGFKQEGVSARPFIKKLIKNSHEAVLELGGMINVRFICDRGVSHELVRHRIASFVQESTRYCNYASYDHIEFIIPSFLPQIPELTSNKVEELNQLIPEQFIGRGDREAVDMGFKWAMMMLRAQNGYLDLIKFGKWSPQQARSVLPNSLKTEIVVGANLREWRHIFKLRTAKVAHPQMRELMCPLLDEFKKAVPVIFDDIVY